MKIRDERAKRAMSRVQLSTFNFQLSTFNFQLVNLASSFYFGDFYDLHFY